MSSNRTIWLNGKVLPEDQACISPFDLGFYVGDGCFELLITQDGIPFAFSRHYERLLTSARKMRMQVKTIPSKEEMFQAVRAVMERNRIPDPARIRIVVTSGLSLLGGLRCGAPCTVMVSVVPGSQLADTSKVVTSSSRINETSPLAGIKTLSFIENMLLMADALNQNAEEVIMANTAGNICAGAISNVFWVRDGVVRTCPVEEGAFPGVTRELVIELCEQLGIPVEETTEPYDTFLSSLDEVFLTSSVGGVRPVAMIDDRRLFPGAVTMRLRKAYADLLDDNLDP